MPVVVRLLVAVLPLMLRGAPRGGRTAVTGAATGACSCQAAIPATCYTNCWSRMSVADNAWLLVNAQLGASVPPMDAVIFHCDSRSNYQSLCSARASTTEWT